MANRGISHVDLDIILTFSISAMLILSYLMFSIVVSIPFYSSPAVGWSCLVNTTYMFQSPTPALPPPDPDTCALARRPQTDMFVAEAKQRATRDPEQDKTFWEKYVRPVMVLRIFHSTLDLFILCSSFAFSIPL